ncbi:MAG TPA: thaumatin family protein, partial [Methanoregulaceae archaeon]|nr:thaumatin family protein [Methanoregulaceae archaeon]
MNATCECLDSPDSPCACPRDNTTNTPCTCIPAGCTCLDNVSGTTTCGCPDSPDSPCDCPGIPAAGTSCDCSPAGDEAPITSPEIVCDSAPAGGNCTFGTYNSTNRTYENHTVYFRNNCSQSIWIAANMGPNGPPFVLNNATQGRGCTGCSCAGPTDAGWENGGCCCPAISCTHQSCPNSTCSLGTALPNGGGFEVPPGLPVNYTVRADSEYGGNAALFPRYGCTLSADGMYLDCDTGTCFVQGTPGTPPRGIVQCGGVPPNGPPDGSPQLPTTKMEIFFAPTGWQQTDSDFYDVSLADGYNIPVRIEPVPGTFWTGGTAHNWCIPAGGTADLLGKIREPQYHNLSMKMLILKSSRPVAIWSSCSYETQVNKTGPGQANATTTPGQGEGIWNLSCCKGNHATEATCPIGNLPADHQTSQFFGAFFNHTYTYPYGDDQ